MRSMLIGNLLFEINAHQKFAIKVQKHSLGWVVYIWILCPCKMLCNYDIIINLVEIHKQLVHWCVAYLKEIKFISKYTYANMSIELFIIILLQLGKNRYSWSLVKDILLPSLIWFQFYMTSSSVKWVYWIRMFILMSQI